MHRDSALISVSIALILLAGCPESKEPVGQEQPTAAVPTVEYSSSISITPHEPELQYKLIDEEIYDIPIVTRITQKYLVEGEPTKDNLRELLMEKYNEATKRTSFTYHDHPTAVFLSAFTNSEFAESSPANWLARLEKTEGSEPSFIFNVQQYELLKSEPVEKLGMSEEQRIAIWHEICWYEGKAHSEAEKKYQDPNDYEPCWDYEDSLVEEYRNEIASRHSIPYETLMEIYTEGYTRGWPYPPTGYSPPTQ